MAGPGERDGQPVCLPVVFEPWWMYADVGGRFEYPWPVDSGSRRRLLTAVRALCRCGPTELFSITPDTRADFDEPDRSLGLGDVGRVSVRPAGARFGGVVHPLLPATIPIGDRHRVSHALDQFASARYDLVWCFNVRSWILAGAPQGTPAVIDLDDLEHLKIRGRLSIDATDRVEDQAAKSRRRYAAVDRWERWPGQAWSQLEALRWVRLYRWASTRVARTVVCSPLDADRATSSGVKRVTVVPNVYELPDQPVGRIGVGSSPIVLFQGTLRYPPNADAARWLVGEVAPCGRAPRFPMPVSVWSDWPLRTKWVSTVRRRQRWSGRYPTW